MQEQLDSPQSLDAPLYEARGEVPLALPLMQGDVFDQILVPSLSETPITVQIVSHPCTMRQGPKLRSRLTIAPVAPDAKINDFVWRRHVNKMPLPDLREEDNSYSADFRDVAPVMTDQLSLSKRVAALSNEGILLLQQRYIYCQTRLVVDIATLGEVSASIFMETELQRDWVEECLDHTGAGEEPMKVVQDGIEAFQGWLSEDGGVRREKLQKIHLHTAMRREVRAELKARFGADRSQE